MLLTPPSPHFAPRFAWRGSRVLVARPKVTRWQAVHVREGATAELPRARGAMTVHCRKGEAWITHDGDPRDIVLRANESHVVDRDQRLTVHALQGDCSLELQVVALEKP